MATNYNYSITTNFGGSVNTTQLHSEIVAQQGSFVPVFDGINSSGDNVDIIFNSALSGAEETTLDGIVSAHTAVFPLSKGSFYFQGYSTTQTTITTSWTDIPIETEVIKDSVFTHTASSAEVTVTTPGDYVITIDTSILSTSGTGIFARSNAAIRLMVDTGSGYTEVPGTRRWIYVRQSNFGGSASITRYISVSAGDKFKVQADKITGNSTTALLTDGSQFFIKSA